MILLTHTHTQTSTVNKSSFLSLMRAHRGQPCSTSEECILMMWRKTLLFALGSCFVVLVVTTSTPLIKAAAAASLCGRD